MIDLSETDEEGKYVPGLHPKMVGYGDFRGYHLNDSKSRYTAMINRIKEGKVSDPTLKGKFLNQTREKWFNFCCDTGSSTNLMPIKMAALNGLEYSALDKNEPNSSSVSNHRLEIVGQTHAFVRLEKVNRPVKLSFLVCKEDGNEAILSLDTLKDLGIVSCDFPCPMDSSIRDHKVRRVEEEVDWPGQKLRDEEQRGKEKQRERKVKDTKWSTLQERIWSLRTQLSFKQENEEEWKEEDECEAIRKAWLEDF